MTSPMDDVLHKYQQRLETATGGISFSQPSVQSREYTLFRKEALEKKFTYYEQWCQFAERVLPVRANVKENAALQESLSTCHLDISPNSTASFAALVALLVVFFGVLLGVVSYLLQYPLFFASLFFVVTGVVLIKPLSHLPHYFATRWRLQVSNQMVLCILYMVMYMRHTSNLEHAVKFAAEHLGGPLSLDFKRVFWHVETGKHFTIKESLDAYLEQWRKYNLEFLEAFHLIEGSLYESSETKRVELLEKALQVMLDGTYDKMLHYAHNLKSPITMLHMLGIILPILGLVLFPLIGSFLSGLIKWYHLAFLYNLLLPFVVMALGSSMLSKRPTGYGESDILVQRPNLKQYQSLASGISPASIAFVIIALFCFLGLLPVAAYFIDPSQDFSFFQGKFFDYKDGNGPYGIGALFLSLLIPLGLSLGLAFYYWIKSRKLVAFKEKTDALEVEFSGALFQLGNRIGDGIPAELAFGDVSQQMQGTPTGDFFRIVNMNIRNAGMGMKDAIFHPQRGALLFFPSALIESTMKVLIESAKKGSQIVSKSLLTISDYITRIYRINERLKDLLADVLSSMTSQITFLTPLIAGIVVGVGSMVVTIINKLGEQFATLETPGEGFVGGIGALVSVLDIKDVIPSYYFQLVVGIYVVELTIILTLLSTRIERGYDQTTTQHRLSKNLMTAGLLYFLVSFLGIIVFTLLANTVSFVGVS
ncbi:hypothetical protein HYS50_03150 [Candidatus Woesearchaeota archaeon]|nr:hypothetical protein [Candidatus Woesearchaeota archaeon]